jgi:hypothetical protein
MNKVVDALTLSQVELVRSHIHYLITAGLTKQTPEGIDFAGCYQEYIDPVTENLCHFLLPKISKAYGEELVPSYSFWRMYLKGQDCPPHKDRPACDVSFSLSLGGDGGDDWEFYASDDLNKSDFYKITEKDKKFTLLPGQGVTYKGYEQPHWRGSLKYKSHTQVFLHYIDKKGSFYPKYNYDQRPNLYCPPDSRRESN